MMSDRDEQTQSPDTETPMAGDPEIFGGMLNSIMANYFEYESPNGQTANLAELLLLIRQSINENTAAIKNHTKAVVEHKRS